MPARRPGSSRFPAFFCATRPDRLRARWSHSAQPEPRVPTRSRVSALVAQQRPQQLPHRQARDRVAQVGADFGQRAEHEEAARGSAGAAPTAPSPASTSSPARIRSRSSVRGAPGYGRSRPKSRSMAQERVEELARRTGRCRRWRPRSGREAGRRGRRLRGRYRSRRRPGDWRGVRDEPRFDGEGDGRVAIAEIAAEGDRHPATGAGTAAIRPSGSACTPPPVPAPSARRPSRSLRPASAWSKKRWCSAVSPRITFSIVRWRAWLRRVDPRRHLSRKLWAPVAILAEDRVCLRRPCRWRSSVGSGDVWRAAAHVGDGVAQPVELQVLAGDHVLIGVVEVVVGDQARRGDVALAHGQLVAVELGQEVEQFGGVSRALLFLAGDADAGPRNGLQPGRRRSARRSRGRCRRCPSRAGRSASSMAWRILASICLSLSWMWTSLLPAGLVGEVALPGVVVQPGLLDGLAPRCPPRGSRRACCSSDSLNGSDRLSSIVHRRPFRPRGKTQS